MCTNVWPGCVYGCGVVQWTVYNLSDECLHWKWCMTRVTFGMKAVIILLELNVTCGIACAQLPGAVQHCTLYKSISMVVYSFTKQICGHLFHSFISRVFRIINYRLLIGWNHLFFLLVFLVFVLNVFDSRSFFGTNFSHSRAVTQSVTRISHIFIGATFKNVNVCHTPTLVRPMKRKREMKKRRRLISFRMCEYSRMLLRHRSFISLNLFHVSFIIQMQWKS